MRAGGRRAQILLLADEAHTDGGRIDADIAAIVDVSVATVERVRRRCVEEGLEAALECRVQANRKPRKRDGAGEAARTTIACSDPPEGRAGWTLILLGERRVEMGVVESIATETVRVALKKRLEAVAVPFLVHSTPEERRLRGGHGGCSGCLSPGLRRRYRPGVRRRSVQATDEGGAYGGAGGTGTAGSYRLRV